MDGAPHYFYDVPRPHQLSRLLIFLKWFLIIPHTIILGLLGFVASLAAFAAWWIILFTGVYPRGLWQFVFFYIQWNARVTVYTCLLRDEYPPIGEGLYPLEFWVQRPEQSSRGLVIGRIFLAIPLGLWQMVLAFVLAFVLIYAWFAILFTGTIPTGAFDLSVGILRYYTRVTCYLYMLTDVWPGFHLENPGA